MKKSRFTETCHLLLASGRVRQPGRVCSARQMGISTAFILLRRPRRCAGRRRRPSDQLNFHQGIRRRRKIRHMLPRIVFKRDGHGLEAEIGTSFRWGQVAKRQARGVRPRCGSVAR